MYSLLTGERQIPAPALVAAGQLFFDADGWPWPYLVSEAIPGESLSQVEARVRFPDKLAIARFLAPVVRRIYTLTPTSTSPLAPTWDAFDRFLDERRARCVESHRAWGSLPERLVAQLDDYLPPPADLVDQTVPPRVLHCDLNADHLLGSFEGERWRPIGVIDFAAGVDDLASLAALLWDPEQPGLAQG